MAAKAEYSKDRMGKLERAAEKYFRSRPNQNEESRIAAFITEALRLSTFRHQVAHGLLVGKEDKDGQRYYAIVPPSHGFFRLTKKHRQYYSYGSAEIDAFADSFIELARSVQAFNHERHRLK